MSIPVEIVEVGPRDGLQSQPTLVDTDTKIEFITRLVDAGVRRLEVASFVNPKRVPQMVDADQVIARLPRRPGVSYIGLVLNTRGFERALASGIDQINSVAVASDTFCQRNQGVTSAEMYEQIRDMARAAQAAGRFFGVTIAAFVITWWLLQKTRVGLMVRAVTQNKEIAAAHGIDAGRVYTLTFAYGAGLAGLAGAMFGAIKNVFPDMGSGYIVEAFLVVVVGGVGSLAGSLVSALGLGEIYAVFAYFTNGTFAKFWLFLLVVIFLRFRPQGLFSEALARR